MRPLFIFVGNLANRLLEENEAARLLLGRSFTHCGQYFDIAYKGATRENMARIDQNGASSQSELHFP